MLEARPESYHGLTVLSGPVPGRDAFGRTSSHLFVVLEGDAEVFRLAMTVHYTFAASYGDSPEMVAETLGEHWVHGLLDVERYEQGEGFEETRGEQWNPAFANDDYNDEDLGIEVLAALRRSNLARRRGWEPWLDVEGFAAVTGIAIDRVKGALIELQTKGLITAANVTFDRGLEDGACQITADGLKALTTERADLASFITIDDIDSFELVAAVSTDQVMQHLTEKALLDVPEEEVKQAIQAILKEPNEFKDWGGERSDVFTTRLVYEGQRTPTAFLLKGPAVGHTLYPADLGKRGDQDLRLFTEPADLFVVQFNGKIDSSVVTRLRIHAEHRAGGGSKTIVCVIDGADTARLLMAYGVLG